MRRISRPAVLLVTTLLSFILCLIGPVHAQTGTPTATPQTVSVAHNIAKAVTLTGTDPDNPPLKLTFAIVTSPVHGTLGSMNPTIGVVSYRPDLSFQGTDSFTFSVSNGMHTSTPAKVTLEVAPGVPKADTQSVDVLHNTEKAITLTGVDPDVPVLKLTFAIAVSPAHGNLTGLNAASGTVAYTPDTSFQGPDSFTFTVSNGTNKSLAARVTLKVAPGTPTADAQSVNVAHNTAKSIALKGSDPDIPALKLTFAVAASPTHGTVSDLNSATGAVTYTPVATFHGVDSFTFKVSNGVNTSAPAKVTLTVPIGAPIANSQIVIVPLNTPTLINLTASDPEYPALSLTFAVATLPFNGVLSGLDSTTGEVTYTPNMGFNGVDKFTFTVSNGVHTSTPGTVTIGVGSQLQSSAWPKYHQNNMNTGLGLGSGAVGTVAWKFLTGGHIFSSPAIGADYMLYFTSDDGSCYALDSRTGTSKWTFKTGVQQFETTSSPLIGVDGTVYFGTFQGLVYALNGQTGAIKWQCETNNNVSSSPAIGPDGTIFVGCDDFNLYAIDGQTGMLRWTFLTGGAVSSSPAFGNDGTVYVGSADGYVYAINSETHLLKWKFITGGGVDSSPAISNDGTLYIGSNDDYVYAINSTTGLLKWKYKTGNPVGSSPAIGANGVIYVGSGDGKVYALNPQTGDLVWSYQTGAPVYSSPAIGSDGTVYIGSLDFTLYALDGQTGVKKWSWLEGSVLYSPPTVGGDGGIYIGTYDQYLYKIE